MEEQLIAEGKSVNESLLKAAEEYAVECAMLKVAGSETLDFVADEGVQIFGGYGYSSDFPMDRAYRDSRINRIFEGTNEINRLLTVDMLLKRAMKGELDLMTPAQNVQKELMGIPEFGNGDTDLFHELEKYIANFKKAILLTAGAAVQKLMMQLSKEQEILMNIADMAIDTYLAESTFLRVKKLVQIKGADAVSDQTDMLRVFISDAADRIFINGKTAINSFAEGDEQRMMLLGIKRFTKTSPLNTKEARRRIAGTLIEAGKYCY
jgi:hypothetical protein